MECNHGYTDIGTDKIIITFCHDPPMTDEYTVCTAAFFRNKGKNVITENEFLMVMSMDLHWMPYGNAKELLSILLSNGILEKNGEFLRPAFEISDVDVPVAYRPSEQLVRSLKERRPAPKQEKKVPAPDNLLQGMIAAAMELGMEKRDFVSEANTISKRLDVDMLVAGLIILRERGEDITPYADKVYEAMKEK